MPSARRVLLVGDAVLAASLAEQFARESDFSVVTATTAAQARETARASDHDFILIDSDLAGGPLLAGELRASGGAVLLLGGPDAASGRANSIARPFRFAALLARLHAMLGADASRIGPYLFEPGAKTLTPETGEKIRLTEKETGILKFLHASGGVVPRDTLLHEVWGYSPTVTTHTLETHIYRLRRKIEDGLLVSEGGGYRLMV